MPSGFPFNLPSIPTPEEGPRRRYVIMSLFMGGTSLEHGVPVEVEWIVTMRRANAPAGGPEYEMRVVQKPGRPAPYEVNAIVEIDPRLLDGASPYD